MNSKSTKKEIDNIKIQLKKKKRGRVVKYIIFFGGLSIILLILYIRINENFHIDGYQHAIDYKLEQEDYGGR